LIERRRLAVHHQDKVGAGGAGIEAGLRFGTLKTLVL
jgi:hypothetical protein